jgi:hypothetical protein
MAAATAEFYAQRPLNEWVVLGCDPGRVTLLATTFKDPDGTSVHMSLSRDEYYAAMKVGTNRLLRERWDRNALGVDAAREDLARNSSKTASLVGLRAHIACVVRHNPLLWAHALKRRNAQMRFAAFSAKRSCVDRFCRRVWERATQRGRRKLMVAYGGAKFSSTGRGEPGGAPTTWLVARCRLNWCIDGATFDLIDEYLTSQMSSWTHHQLADVVDSRYGHCLEKRARKAARDRRRRARAAAAARAHAPLAPAAGQPLLQQPQRRRQQQQRLPHVAPLQQQQWQQVPPQQQQRLHQQLVAPQQTEQIAPLQQRPAPRQGRPAQRRLQQLPRPRPLDAAAAAALRLSHRAAAAMMPEEDDLFDPLMMPADAGMVIGNIVDLRVVVDVQLTQSTVFSPLIAGVVGAPHAALEPLLEGISHTPNPFADVAPGAAPVNIGRGAVNAGLTALVQFWAGHAPAYVAALRGAAVAQQSATPYTINLHQERIAGEDAVDQDAFLAFANGRLELRPFIGAARSFAVRALSIHFSRPQLQLAAARQGRVAPERLLDEFLLDGLRRPLGLDGYAPHASSLPTPASIANATADLRELAAANGAGGGAGRRPPAPRGPVRGEVAAVSDVASDPVRVDAALLPGANADAALEVLTRTIDGITLTRASTCLLRPGE